MTIDHVVDELALVESQEPLSSQLSLLTLKSPMITRLVKPGQFVHLRLPSRQEAFLRRPFSVYGADPNREILEILYQVVGRGTEVMTHLAPGDHVSLIGPNGHGWQPPASCSRALLVGGGVGAAPLYMLAQTLKDRAVDFEVIIGAQTAEGLVTHDRFATLLGRPPKASTDDGSFGFAGFCTPLLEESLREGKARGNPFDYLALCGPEPLMRFGAQLGLEQGIYTEVSLERKMACGVGACLSCVAQSVNGLVRVCTIGPVFDAAEVVW